MSIVAVVDDDPRILESLQDLLESAGHEVVLHSSGAGLLAGDLSRVDCLITDIGLPVMDGFELRERARRARPELPVLLISGRRELAGARDVNDEAEGTFFRKPFNGPALLAAIAAALPGARG